MNFIANKEQQNREMLAELGVKNVEELLRDIPKDIIQNLPKSDDGLSEYEVLALAEAIAAKNSFPHFDNYIGAGAYEHHVPALVGAICSKSEFLTAYTPYQAEMSQGMLQAIFEFQSVVCSLTGMDVANASVYDGASACAEAVLMALRITPERNKIVVSQALHPHYRAVVEEYVKNHGVEIATSPLLPDDRLDLDAVKQQLDDKTAAILIQSPNFFGVMEDAAPLFAIAKEKGILSILCANPLAYGIYASAGEVGADIAVGDMQPFGLPLQFGGPYVGYMACREALVRQLPGRLVGETTDAKERRGYVLTLQAREQHIRREKATSNICTNQALAALATLVGVLWYGPEGVRKLAMANFQRASYLRERLGQIPGFKTNDQPIFNEFVLQLSRPASEALAHCRMSQIEAGLDLARYFPERKNQLLVAVTETKSLEKLERFIAVIGG